MSRHYHSQYWAALLTHLRKQWQQELLEKFALPSQIVESPAFRRHGITNAFDRDGTVVICSYQLAAAKAFELTQIPWNLVVIDEAHRLRNVYKTCTRSLVASPLLSATPPKAAKSYS